MRAKPSRDRAEYQCDVCEAKGVWTRDWQHYGSIAIDEACGHRVDTCSEDCRATDRARALIAEFALNHQRRRPASLAHRGATCAEP